MVYPRENAQLFGEIASHGAVISEYPPQTPALAAHFPRRNRIISGLSRGVIVVEAGEKSGTLRTVDYGLEQGRDIYAVPGPITSASSRGTNRLLRQGAKMVLETEDILQEYREWLRQKRQPACRPSQETPSLSPEERKLLQHMLLPRHFDELLSIGPYEAPSLAALLTILELRGLVKQLPGKYYQTVVKRL